MAKTVAFLILGLAVGLAAASLWLADSPQPAEQAGSADDLRARVSALEQALNREILQRAELEAELAALTRRLEPSLAEVAAEDAAQPEALREPELNDEALAVGEASAAAAFARRGARRDLGASLTQRLLESGFSADRAQWISQRTEELRMQALQAQYDAAREGERFDPRSLAGAGSTLRGELGDADYERYLEATGRPTSVRVDNVLASSPAEQAGLLPGDEVVAYSGERVFSNIDLNRLILEGNPGEPVTVDLLRDGQTMQLVIPRGPLGISGGRGFRGR
jgi:C-terminal processing protease CtpA/Prc